ncbi:hypothetical protein [Mesorhizobium sp. ES1-1]|uniref:hypothetical protein n=1 Tax=Mesorhizobium sp. ES1-1 TaxID=2876629 RepID=UPI001CCF8B9C|nr:hypothetical protein [Mesorhizobium sp. ES1-1]MBZ9677624.1 hypothetical protein [Mesorhizobium sp. ES1-1]
MAEHLPATDSDDPVFISDLAGQAMKAAVQAGLDPNEIAEETDSVLEVIFEAMKNRAGGLAVDPRLGCFGREQN